MPRAAPALPTVDAERTAAIGYCLGGKIAFLMATRSDADCNVGYYGVGLGGSNVGMSRSPINASAPRTTNTATAALSF